MKYNEKNLKHKLYYTLNHLYSCSVLIRVILSLLFSGCLLDKIFWSFAICMDIRWKSCWYQILSFLKMEGLYLQYPPFPLMKISRRQIMDFVFVQGNCSIDLHAVVEQIHFFHSTISSTEAFRSYITAHIFLENVRETQPGLLFSKVPTSCEQ